MLGSEKTSLCIGFITMGVRWIYIGGGCMLVSNRDGCMLPSDR